MGRRGVAGDPPYMPATLAPDEREFLATVRQFAADEVLPHTREWEAAPGFPDAIWPRLGELGLLTMTLS
ncbi:MAG: hypothetical protein C4320_04460, partial [Armatimonadota bacterium]